MPTLDVGGPAAAHVQIDYEDVGYGRRPVVLIHGWPLSSRMWEPQVGALVEAGYRVVAYDRRGFGRSSQPWNGYDYDTFAADLHELLTTLDLREATLVGFSMGGGEVARYVSHFGASRVAQAVFACAVTPCMSRAVDPEGAIDEATMEQMLAGVRQDRLAFLEGFTRAFYSVDGRLLVSEAQRAHACDVAAFASPRGTLECIRAFSTTDFRPDLARFGHLPSLVLHGDADAIVPLAASGARTAKLLKQARLAVVPGGPHGFNLSHAEAFNRHLLEFLQEV
jgi:pimeloyl-ACP methyl ester carboxylesterase